MFRMIDLRRHRAVLAVLGAVACALLLISPLCAQPITVPAQAQSLPKTVYLTFDDGPSENTVRLLNLLEEKGVKATFFVTGYRYDGADEVLRRIVADGHALGLHTDSHVYEKIYASAEAFLADFDTIERRVYEVTGVRSTLCRFPGGSVNSHCPKWMRAQITDGLTARGYVWYDWNVVSGDQTAVVYPAGRLFDNVLEAAGKQDPLVLLFHDTPLCTTTPEAVALLIDYYTAQGWRFQAITPDTPPIQFYKGRQA